jgi:ketosteroid isomerase-like protein
VLSFFTAPEGGIVLLTHSNSHRFVNLRTLALFAAAFLLAIAAPARAQKTKIKQVPEPPSAPVAVNHVIDLDIAQMLGAWQIGDVEKMRKFYADDVLIVSEAWQPPIYTWANYLPAYQSQHARMTSIHLDRTNTVIRVNENSAWATYQWELTTTVDGNKIAARGDTTLVFQKRDGNWLIVLNHTSVAPDAAPAPAAKPNL